MTLKSKADRVFIPGDLVLPDPAILRKLAALDEGAVPWIMERMKERQELAFAADHASLKTSFMSTVRSGAFWRGFLSAFAFFPAASPRPDRARLTRDVERDAFMSVNHAWANTGNHLREAILDYMVETGIPASILSDHETESLWPLKLTL